MMQSNPGSLVMAFTKSMNRTEEHLVTTELTLLLVYTKSIITWT